MTDVLINRKDLEIDMQKGKTVRRHRQCDEMKAEINRVMHLQDKGCQWSASKTTKAGEEAWDRFYLTALKRNQCHQPLDLRFLGCRSGRQYISVVEATKFVVCHKSSLRKQIQ